jgi:hypothetical protein
MDLKEEKRIHKTGASKNFGGYMEVRKIKMAQEKSPKPLLSLGGRYWIRTSDLFRVNEM